MIVISAKDLTKEYGTDIILDKVSFHINGGDRVGIVGANGAGKTTLLKMLAGELSCDGGDFFISADITLGYLKQTDDFQSDRTVIEEVEAIFSHLKALDLELMEIAGQIADCIPDSSEQRKLIHRQSELAEAFQKQGASHIEVKSRDSLQHGFRRRNLQQAGDHPQRWGEDKTFLSHAPSQETGPVIFG